MRIFISSKNKHKIKEIKDILADCKIDLQIFSFLDSQNSINVVEDKTTIEENAIKKAVEVAKYTKMLTLADDTGLFVEALNGEPGVYSARYAGENCNFDDNKKKLLTKMKGQKNRKAFFKTVIALADDTGLIAYEEGRLKGFISDGFRGERGFGYDNMFIVDKFDKTFAELPEKEKNFISHRRIALQKIVPLIKDYFLKNK